MNRLVSFITGGWAAGITLAPFGIYLIKRYMSNQYMINHESIHWKQQMEMLILPFYLWYLIEWFLKLIIHGKTAYYYLSFEREAYLHQNDLKYLKTRKHFAWIKLLRVKI